MRIVIAGGAGLLGGALSASLREARHEVVVLTRRSPAGPGQATWTPDGTAGAWGSVVDGADAIVNLSGESIAGARWTEARKRTLLDSRVVPTRSLAAAVRDAARPPKVFLQASAVGYYGPRGDEMVTEDAGPGDDFLARTCVAWEASAAPLAGMGLRVAWIRTGLVLAADGGVLGRLLLPFKLGVGGPFGDGRQFMPWIHVADWVALVRWMLETDGATGPCNASAPEPVTNGEFSATLGRVLGRPHVVRAPAFALRAVLGEMADAVLTGQRAVPRRPIALGFHFRFETLEPALRDLLRT
jgi:uncharacterized protein (TIGR01777 family)